MTEAGTFRTSTHHGLAVGVDSPAPGVAVVALQGRLDAVATPDLRDRLDEADVRGCPQVVFDLTSVDFVDSAGLAVLVWQRRFCREQDGDVVLIRPKADATMRVFRLTQCDQVFRMLPEQQDS